MKQMLTTLIGFTITGTLILFVVAITTTNITEQGN